MPFVLLGDVSDGLGRGICKRNTPQPGEIGSENCDTVSSDKGIDADWMNNIATRSVASQSCSLDLDLLGMTDELILLGDGNGSVKESPWC